MGNWENIQIFSDVQWDRGLISMAGNVVEQRKDFSLLLFPPFLILDLCTLCLVCSDSIIADRENNSMSVRTMATNIYRLK